MVAAAWERFAVIALTDRLDNDEHIVRIDLSVLPFAQLDRAGDLCPGVGRNIHLSDRLVGAETVVKGHLEAVCDRTVDIDAECVGHISVELRGIEHQRRTVEALGSVIDLQRAAVLSVGERVVEPDLGVRPLGGIVLNAPALHLSVLRLNGIIGEGVMLEQDAVLRVRGIHLKGQRVGVGSEIPYLKDSLVLVELVVKPRRRGNRVGSVRLAQHRALRNHISKFCGAACIQAVVRRACGLRRRCVGEDRVFSLIDDVDCQLRRFAGLVTRFRPGQLQLDPRRILLVFPLLFRVDVCLFFVLVGNHQCAGSIRTVGRLEPPRYIELHDTVCVAVTAVPGQQALDRLALRPFVGGDDKGSDLDVALLKTDLLLLTGF